MGTELRAFLEIDDNTRSEDPPFTNDCSAWDLTPDYGLSGAKDYEWYAALAGVRNETATQPLYALRGLPSNANVRTKEYMLEQSGTFSHSWLTLTEIITAMAHMHVARSQLSESANLLLSVMSTIESSLGKDRVRLVFGFS